MFKNRGFGIRTKLIFIYLLIAIPLTVLLEFSLYDRFLASRQDALNERREIARLTVSNFTLFIQQIQDAEIAIGQAVTEQEFNKQQASAYLSRVAEEYPVSNLALLGPDGIIQAASLTSTIGQDRSNHPVVQAIMNGEESAVGNLQQNADGGPGFLIATGIRRDVSLTGIIAMSINANRLDEVLDVAIQQGGVNIVDSRGFLIFQSQQPTIPFSKRDWSDEEFAQAALAGMTFTSTGLTFPVDDSFRMGVEVPIPSIGWAAGSFVPVGPVLGPVRRAALFNALVALFIISVAFSLAYVLGNRLIQALITLKLHMREAPSTGFTRPVAISTGDEIEDLADSFNLMQGEILAAQTEQRRLQQALQERNEELSSLYEKQKDIAVVLQQSLLPKIAEEIDHLKIGLTFQSATEAALVGGDFYDFIEISSDKFGIVMGDVSGKGIEAATLSATIRNTLRAFAYDEPSPAKVIGKVNRIAVAETPASVFVTLFYGVFDANTYMMTYANAGHWPPIVFNPIDDTAGELEQGGLPIGVFPRATYTDFDIKLEPGSLIVLFTDGVVESRSDAKLFGMDNLKQSIMKNAGLTPNVLARKLVESSKKFGGGKLNDDAAVMVIKVITP